MNNHKICSTELKIHQLESKNLIMNEHLESQLLFISELKIAIESTRLRQFPLLDKNSKKDMLVFENKLIGVLLERLHRNRAMLATKIMRNKRKLEFLNGEIVPGGGQVLPYRDTCKTCKHPKKIHIPVDKSHCLYHGCDCKKFIKLNRCKNCDHAKSTHHIHGVICSACTCKRFEE